MRLNIYKRPQSTWLTLFVFWMPFFFAPLMEWLHIPSFIKYSVDFANLLLLALLCSKRIRKVHINIRFMLLWVSLFVIYTFLRYLFDFQSILYYIWGARNNFRFYIFFFACTFFLDDWNLERIFQLLDKVFYVHVVVAIFQFLVLGYKQDNLGGIFGTRSGCNGWLNIFQVIIVAIAILQYLDKEINIGECAIKCILCLMIAALAELKFFFVEFIIIVCVELLVTNFSWKKLWIILGALVAIPIFAMVLISLFPGWAQSMTLRGLLEIATSDKGYTSSGDVNRMTFISYCNRNLMQSRIQHIFGYGLGNCDYADGIAFLTTPFYRRFSVTHYTWLISAVVYLENGYIGLVFYFGFFVITFFQAWRIKHNPEANVFYCQLAQVVSVMCIFIAIYNSSLRVESGYMLYFILATPFVKIMNRKVNVKI